MDLDSEWVVRWMRLAASTISENRVELGDLDREIGDGDHGENMDRGFSAVAAGLERFSPVMAPGVIFHAIATELLVTVGGASGPLYSAAFLGASESVGAQERLGSRDVLALLAAARDGIAARGAAQPGDKTMLDAWHPAAGAASQAVDAGESPHGILVAAAEAALLGAESTEPWIARKGRASYLGARAIGHRDPGAQSSALLLRAAAEAAYSG